MGDFFHRIAKDLNLIKSSLKLKGGFVQNFAFMFSSSAVSQLIGLLFVPILSRIYDPVDYGILSIYIALVSILGLFGTMRYSQAFVLSTDKREFKALVHLSFGLTCLITLILIIVFGLFKEPIFEQLKTPELLKFWYLIPIAIFINNLREILAQWNIRDKEFRKISWLSFIKNILGKLIAYGHGIFVNATFLGLLLGELITGFIAFGITYRLTVYHKIKSFLSVPSLVDIKSVAKKYRNYPFWILPSHWLTRLSNVMPILLLTIYTNPVMVGLYSFGIRLLDIPLNLFQNAITPVFYQKAAELFQENRNKLPDFSKKMLYYLLFVSLLIFGILGAFGDLIFKYVFGNKWERAGELSQWFGFYYTFKLLWAVFSSMLKVIRKEQIIFWTGVALLIIPSASLLYGILAKDVILGIKWFSLTNLIIFLCGILIAFSKIKTNLFRLGLFVITFSISVYGGLYLLRLVVDKI